MDYTENYCIIVPRLKTAKNRRATYNKRLGDWTYDFSDLVLKQYQLYALSFNFFILWNEQKTDGDLYNRFWIKREISIKENNKINLKAPVFKEKLFNPDNHPLQEIDKEFLSKHGTKYSYIVIKDVHEKQSISEDENVAIEVFEDENMCLHFYPMNYFILKQELIRRSNGFFRMNKPLKYYETNLEHILSVDATKTGAVFPGDCDMLIYNEELQCMYLLEFKKCTAKGSRIPIEKQSINNYISKDRNKYIRLNILREYFEKCERKYIPLINVFYPTTEETKIKLEGISHDLMSECCVVYEMADNTLENQRLLIEKILENF